MAGTTTQLGVEREGQGRRRTRPVATSPSRSQKTNSDDGCFDPACPIGHSFAICPGRPDPATTHVKLSQGNPGPTFGQESRKYVAFALCMLPQCIPSHRNSDIGCSGTPALCAPRHRMCSTWLPCACSRRPLGIKGRLRILSPPCLQVTSERACANSIF